MLGILPRKLVVFTKFALQAGSVNHSLKKWVKIKHGFLLFKSLLSDVFFRNMKGGEGTILAELLKTMAASFVTWANN